MDFIKAALQETADYPTAQEGLARFRVHLDEEWMREALEASGTATVRKRRLPSEQVVWLVLRMALQRDLPIADVVRSLDLALPSKDGTPIVAPSSMTQVRKRVGWPRPGVAGGPR